MSVPFSNTKLRVPQGFHTLLESLTRELLRKKPANIYDFAATYFENLSKDQKQGKLDESLKQSLLDDRFYNNNSFKESYPINDKSADDAAILIQSSFRGHQAREEVENIKQDTARKEHEKSQQKLDQSVQSVQSRHDDELKTSFKKPDSPVQKHHEVQVAHKEVVETAKPVDTIIQSSFNDSQHSKKEEPPKQQEQHQEPPPKQQPNHEEFNEDSFVLQRNPPSIDDAHLKQEENLNEAAVRIQSTFRGYMTRKQLEEKETPNANAGDEDNAGGDGSDYEEETEEDAKANAATRIQATFRGYKTRKELSGKHDSEHN